MAVQTVGQMKVDLKADIADFRRDMKAATGVFKKQTGLMERNAKRFKTAITGAFATFGVMFGAQAVRAFVANTTKQQNAMAQVTSAIKSTGSAAGLTSKEIFKMASEMQKLTTFGDEDVLSMQAILLTFTKIGKDVFPQATKAVLDMSVRLGQDLKSAAIQVGKALNDPIKGVTALGRAGVQFTDAQKDMIRVMQKSGNIIGAQGLILDELKTQFEGAAEAARGTLGGEITALKNNVGDFFELNGISTKPLIDALEFINGLLREVAESASNTRDEIDGIMKTGTGMGQGFSFNPAPPVKSNFQSLVAFGQGMQDELREQKKTIFVPATGMGKDASSPFLGSLANEMLSFENPLISDALNPRAFRASLSLPGDEPPGRDDLKKNVEEVKEAIKLTRFEMENFLLKTREWKNGAVVAFAQYADAATDAAENTRIAFLNTFNSLEDQLTEFLSTGKLNFKQFVDGVVSDMNRIFVRQNITGPLASFLGQSSFLGGSSKLFNFGGAMAGGGNVSPGAAFLVGEKGPEMFVPDVSGSITPNGGGSISTGDIHVHFEGNVNQDMAMRSAAQVQEEIMLVVREAQRSM